MRIRTLFMSMAAGLAFVGCSSEEDITSSIDNGNNGKPQFLTVSVNATSALTRATISDKDYEEGVDNENEVTKVRFYFFDADNNAAKVKGENGATYHDVEDASGAGQDMPNVEKILTATLVIQTPEKDKVPTSIVAVINPKSDLGAVASISELNEVIADHSNTTSFIMSNSVYANGTTKMEAVNVAGHLYATAEAAKTDPVIIHVERVLAKARLTVNMEANDKGLYKTSSDDDLQKFGDDEIYVKFLGWNVTATAKTSRLMKEINPGWSSSLFGSTLWNTADYYRSFWAVNPEKLEYNYGPFNTKDEANVANAITAFDAEGSNKNYTYLQENASDDYGNGTDPTKPSQVIIAAQLMNAKGDTIEFAEYGGERTTIDGLKAKYAAAAGLWADNTTEDKKGRRTITPEDIELKTAIQAGEANETKPGRYKVYAQLTKEASKLTWYDSSSADKDPIDNANKVLKDLGGAKVWKDGYTYYYFDIRHLNGSSTEEEVKGKTGVVRNHIYAANITKLAGLGTPVYDPNEVIYPEKPGDDDTFIAAQIRILSWRIVNQDISLEW